jgi:hypothetical protein
MPNFDSGDSAAAPALYPVRFLFGDGASTEGIWVYTDVPGDDQFKLENRWQVGAQGRVEGRLLENTKYNFYYTREKQEKAWLEKNLTEGDCELVTTGKAEGGLIKVTLKKRPEPVTTFKVLSLAFRSDHEKLKDNDKDWTKSGALFPKPEWTDGEPQAYPVSHTMESAIEVELEVEMGPEYASPGKAKLTGAGADFLNFEAEVEAKPGKSKHKVKAKASLPRKIQRLDGQKVAWQLAPEGGAAVAGGNASGLTLFVTYDTPKDDMTSKQEDGVTLKRMAKAVEWVAPMGTLEPHGIVAGLMKKFRYYVLYPSEKVPKEFKHPGYMNSVGGAWPMADYASEYGECQAIVRITRGVLRQIGVPGDANIYVVWSDPTVDGGATAIEANWETASRSGLDTRKTEGGKTWAAALVDGAVVEGKEYPPSHAPMPDGNGSSPGLNRYEACLKFTAEGETKYYGGGAGIFASKEEVLKAFWGVIWVSWKSDGGYRVEKIVQKY